MEFKIILLTINNLHELKTLRGENINFHQSCNELFEEKLIDWDSYLSWLTISVVTDNVRVYVAKINNVPIGYCIGQALNSFDLIPSKVGYIMELFVSREHQRCGIGKALIFSLTKWFQAQELDRIEVQYYLGNKEAKKFWDRAGFKPYIIRSALKLANLRGEENK